MSAISLDWWAAGEQSLPLAFFAAGFAAYSGRVESGLEASASANPSLVRLAAIARLRSRSFSRILIFSEKFSAASCFRNSGLLINLLQVLTLE